MPSAGRVLYLVHGHPDVSAGGAEVYALALHEAMQRAGRWESLLLARNGPPSAKVDRARASTRVTAVGKDPSQYFFYTDPRDYDWFTARSRDSGQYTDSLRAFLLAHRPDVVHFQHALHFGYEAIRETRNTLPDAAIVFTLHEFLPICHNHGQMIRTFRRELCDRASPQRCHECFPEISPQEFFLRDRFIRANLDLVDLFVSPSEFLRDRYVEWGIPDDRIVVEENGVPAAGPEPSLLETERPRNRLGFFGQLTPYKGADVLLEAMSRLAQRNLDVRLHLHGSNLELQPSGYRRRLEELLASAPASVHMFGGYSREQLPQLLADVDWVVVPSIWWENSPVVIQEAFLHGRPVICSDIGGMAEKVADEVNGLHFRVGDADSLANTIARAVGPGGLWQKLRHGLRAPHTMEEHVAVLDELYAGVLDAKKRGHAWAV